MHSDAALLARYAESRDAHAFDALCTRYAGMVFGTALRVLGNAHDAEDAAQECFLTLARRAGGVRTSLPAWLHSVAVNCARDMAKARTRRTAHEAGKAAVRNEGRITEEPSWEEIAPYVDQALAELSSDLREPLVLHFLQKQTQAQIAVQLGISQPAVSGRIEKGLCLLRARLKKMGVIVSAASVGVLLSGNAASAAPATFVVALGKMSLAGIGAPAQAAISTGISAGFAKGAVTAGGVIMATTTKVIVASVICVACIVTASILLYNRASPHPPKNKPARPTADVSAATARPALVSTEQQTELRRKKMNDASDLGKTLLATGQPTMTWPDTLPPGMADKYLYIGNRKMSDSEFMAMIPLAMERVSDDAEMCVVLYTDGHVSTITGRDTIRQMREQYFSE